MKEYSRRSFIANAMAGTLSITSLEVSATEIPSRKQILQEESMAYVSKEIAPLGITAGIVLGGISISENRKNRREALKSFTLPIFATSATPFVIGTVGNIDTKFIQPFLTGRSEEEVIVDLQKEQNGR